MHSRNVNIWIPRFPYIGNMMMVPTTDPGDWYVTCILHRNYTLIYTFLFAKTNDEKLQKVYRAPAFRRCSHQVHYSLCSVLCIRKAKLATFLTATIQHKVDLVLTFANGRCRCVSFVQMARIITQFTTKNTNLTAKLTLSLYLCFCIEKSGRNMNVNLKIATIKEHRCKFKMIRLSKLN